MKRILVIKLSAFGDVIQAMGAIRDIRNHHPGDELICMTTPAFREVMERCPWVDRVIIDPRDARWRLAKMAGLRRNLRNLGLDMVYDLQQVGRTAFYRRWFLPDLPWVGNDPGYRSRNQSRETPGAMERFAGQLAGEGISVTHTLQPDVSWLADDASTILTNKQVSKPFVVLIPGASQRHAEKRWPLYDDLAAWLRKMGRIAVTVPGPDELTLCHSFNHAVTLTDGDPYLSFFELAGVLKQAEFVVGNDTGPTHLAAHLSLRGLALFSSYFPPSRTGIQHTRFSVLETEDLRTLSLEQVQQALAPLLH